MASKCLGWRTDHGRWWCRSEGSPRGWVLSPQKDREGGNPKVLALLEVAWFVIRKLLRSGYAPFCQHGLVNYDSPFLILIHHRGPE